MKLLGLIWGTYMVIQICGTLVEYRKGIARWLNDIREEDDYEEEEQHDMWHRGHPRYAHLKQRNKTRLEESA